MVEPLTATKPATLPNMILTTKLYIPPVHPNLVSRPHLISRLNNALHLRHKLILLSASPGFGKTTLLSDWIHQKDELPAPSSVQPTSFILHPSRVAWVSLDEDDNNPHRFLAYCVSALQTIQPGVGQAAIAMLQGPDLQQLTPDMLVTALINEASPITDPFIFVLDDYHLIQNPTIHNSLTFLLDNMPPHVHLVIATRTDPPLPLARLRGRGQLTELDTADLRFTPAEAAAFLNQAMGLNLTASQVSDLESKTEGWIAGLQMAALAMQTSQGQDAAGFVKAFTGSHRYILDYLLEEVLNRQPEHVQKFLLQSSILNRMCSSLCDAVITKSGELTNQDADSKNLKPLEDSQSILEYLEQGNLFIISLDNERRWYRYHHLFTDLLKHRLEQATPGKDELPALHRRASAWYEQNGFPVEAMSHALAAVDVERVVRLAQQKAATMLSRSEMVTLLSWLDTLPRAMERSRPYLSLLHAWAMLLTGEFQAVETHLEEAERELALEGEANDTSILGEIATLRGGAAYFQRDMPGAISLYRQALEHLSPDNLFMRGIVMQCLGAAYSWCGNVVEATRAFDQAGTISQNTGNMLVALVAMWNLAQLYAEQGYLHQAAEVYRQTLNLVERQPETDRHTLRPFVGRLYIGLAELMYQWNDLENAEQHTIKGLELGQESQESSGLTSGYLGLTRIKHAQGDENGALESLQKARYFARRYAGPRYLIAQASIFQAHLWLDQGNLHAVAHWVNEHQLQLARLPNPIPYLLEDEYLVAAQLLLTQNQQGDDKPLLPVESPLSTALEIVASIYSAAQKDNRTGRMLEVLILQALVLQAQGNQKQALSALEEALILAESEGYIRIFVDKGTPMLALLREAKTRNISSKIVPVVLAAFKTGHSSPVALEPLVEPLSERELEILRLIATGMSNKELAEELVVTVGTVKWHLNNIYSKLGVRSRTQAVAKARELELV